MSTQPLPSPSLPSAGGGPIFPVGHILISADATNPATWLGYGTWTAIGPGRVLVGQDTGDADFDTLGETGGAKTASHTHGAGTLTTDTHGGHTHGAGTLATSAHVAATVAAHASHAHHIRTSGSATISAHSSTVVASHATSAFNHKHDISSASLATISAHAQHRHVITKGNLPEHNHDIAAGTFSHSHTQQVRSNNTAGTAGSQGASAANTTSVGTTNSWTQPLAATNNTGNAGTCYTEYETQGAHTLGGGTEYADGAPSAVTHAGHVHDDHTLGGDTEGPILPVSHDPHTHDAHTMSGATATDGGHNHSVNSGATASGGGSIVQPYLVVIFWQRTA